MEQMNKFGGAMWDTLFLLVQDHDNEFILNFVERLPCNTCAINFYKVLRKKNISLNDLSKEETYKKLWKLRCLMNPKYKDKDNSEELNNYLKFLLIKK